MRMARDQQERSSRRMISSPADPPHCRSANNTPGTRTSAHYSACLPSSSCASPSCSSSSSSRLPAKTPPLPFPRPLHRPLPTPLLLLLVLLPLALSGRGGFVQGASAAVYNGVVGYRLLKAGLMRKGYTRMAEALDLSGANNTLIAILPKFKITILAPSNLAFQPATVQGVLKNKKKLLQLVSFHIFEGRFSFEQLKVLKTGTLFKTADYGLKIEKLKNPSKIVIGRPKMNWGTTIQQRDIYQDPQVFVQGVNLVLFPPYFK